LTRPIKLSIVAITQTLEEEEEEEEAVEERVRETRVKRVVREMEKK